MSQSNLIKSAEGWVRTNERTENGRLAHRAYRKLRDHRPRKTAMNVVPRAIAAAEKVAHVAEGETVVRAGRKVRRVVIA